MKLIVKINDESARYFYCVYNVFDHDNGTCSEDTRIFESDNLDEFTEFISRDFINSYRVYEDKEK